MSQIGIDSAELSVIGGASEMFVPAECLRRELETAGVRHSRKDSGNKDAKARKQ